jgi:hypothetical protein
MCQHLILLSCRIRVLPLVARLQRVDYADNDQGSNRSTQHNNSREIRKAPRKRRKPIHGSKPLYIYVPFWESTTVQVTLTKIIYLLK